MSAAKAEFSTSNLTRLTAVSKPTKVPSCTCQGRWRVAAPSDQRPWAPWSRSPKTLPFRRTFRSTPRCLHQGLQPSDWMQTLSIRCRRSPFTKCSEANYCRCLNYLTLDYTYKFMKIYFVLFFYVIGLAENLRFHFNKKLLRYPEKWCPVSNARKGCVSQLRRIAQRSSSCVGLSPFQKDESTCCEFEYDI